MSSNIKPLKIFFFSVDGAGHLNACVGMAQALAKRGHQIIFLLNDANAGQYIKFGFEEILLKTPSSITDNQKQQPKNLIKEFADHLIKSGTLSAKSPVEKLRDQLKNGKVGDFIKRLYHILVPQNPLIADAIQQHKPDLVIIDHFLIPPAIPLSGVPWFFLFSGNPLALYDSEKLPPFGAGFSVDSDPATWQDMQELVKIRMKLTFVKYQDMINELFNYNPEPTNLLPSMPYFGSPYLNIYGYPEELDYHDRVPRRAKFIHVDAYIRESSSNDSPFKLPEGFHKSGQKLVYLSLGSMGAVDVDLIKRITTVLGRTPHKYIVSKGPRADEFEVPSNCWGESYLPQTQILPLVDLVITHGGNNTITETFSSGKPMIVFPLFADQYDNAQRVTEKGYGVRLEPYHFKDEELIKTIDLLMNDKDMIERCKVAAARIAASRSKELACEHIEKLIDELKQAKK